MLNVRRRGFTATAQSFKVAEQVACLLDCMPERLAASCIASATLRMAGPYGVGINGHNWGEWAHTCIFTDGHDIPLPSGVVWQRNRWGWLQGESHTAADTLLGFFGLDCQQVMAHYGVPAYGERYTLRLTDIIATLAPHLLETAASIKAS